MKKIEKFLDMAMEQYEGGLPIHLVDPDRSAIKTMSESEFSSKSSEEIQELLRRKHILISDCAGKQLKFDEDGLRTLCPPWQTIEVQGDVFSLIFACFVIESQQINLFELILMTLQRRSC
jgi:hypothetical protein